MTAGIVTSTTSDRALVAACGTALLASAVMSPELLRTILLAASVLLATYALMRPALVQRAIAHVRSQPRKAAITSVASIALLAVALAAGELIRHPAVDAYGEARLWAEADSALSRVAAGAIRWQAAPTEQRAAIVDEVADSVRMFSSAVIAIERARPPAGSAAAHAAAASVYRDLADLLAGLPATLARGDADEAAGVWRRAGVLADRAAAIIGMTSGGEDRP